MSVLGHLDTRGEIVDYQITPSLIRVTERLSYDDADARIGQELRLTQGFEVAQRLRQSRFDSGAIALPIPQVDLFVNPHKHITVRVIDREAPSQILVSEFMILANSLVGQFCAQRQIPIVYRGQAAPRETFPTSLTYDPVLHYRQQRAHASCQNQLGADTSQQLGRRCVHDLHIATAALRGFTLTPSTACVSRARPTALQRGPAEDNRRPKSKRRSAEPARSNTIGDGTGFYAISASAWVKCLRGSC